MVYSGVRLFVLGSPVKFTAFFFSEKFNGVNRGRRVPEIRAGGHFGFNLTLRSFQQSVNN
jgi:hypothetical protein